MLQRLKGEGRPKGRYRHVSPRTDTGEVPSIASCGQIILKWCTIHHHLHRHTGNWRAVSISNLPAKEHTLVIDLLEIGAGLIAREIREPPRRGLKQRIAVLDGHPVITPVW